MKKRVFKKQDQKRTPGGGQGRSGAGSSSRGPGGRSASGSGRGKYLPKRTMDRTERLPKDSGFMDTEPMSIDERKAAQLAKWRKELGLEE